MRKYVGSHSLVVVLRTKLFREKKAKIESLLGRVLYFSFFFSFISVFRLTQNANKKKNCFDHISRNDFFVRIRVKLRKVKAAP